MSIKALRERVARLQTELDEARSDLQSQQEHVEAMAPEALLEAMPSGVGILRTGDAGYVVVIRAKKDGASARVLKFGCGESWNYQPTALDALRLIQREQVDDGSDHF